MEQRKFTKLYRVLDDYDVLTRLFGEKNENGKQMYANAFVYFYRRFGAPINPCDEYKQLAFYCLTTDNPKYALTVSFGSFGFMSVFLYSTDKNLYWLIQKEQRQYIWDYLREKEKWVAEQDASYVSPNLFLNPTKRELKKLNKFFHQWQEVNRERLKSIQDNKELSELFQKEMEEKYETIGKNYPIPAPEKNPFPTPLLDEGTKVLEASLRELLKPVFIRDTVCNILGEVIDS